MVGGTRPAGIFTKPPLGVPTPARGSGTTYQSMAISAQPGAIFIAGVREAVPAAMAPTIIPKVSVQNAEGLKLRGRLVDFLPNWEALSSDAWVLQTVKGFQIELYGFPSQSQRPKPPFLSREQSELVDLEIGQLLEKGTIVQTVLHLNVFPSNLFLVEKRDGGQRPIINLREFN